MDDAERPYRTGYKKPPRSWQFQPGQSGNRRGRPKGAKSRKKIVQRVAGELHQVREGARVRELPIAILVLLALKQKAIGGNLKAAELYERMLNRYVPAAPEEARLLVVNARLSSEEWGRLAGEAQLPETGWDELLGPPVRPPAPTATKSGPAASPAPGRGSPSGQESPPSTYGPGGLLR